MTPFGRFVRGIRAERQMRLHDMARALGVSSAFVSSVETGRKAIPRSWSKDIARVLQLSQAQEKALQEAIRHSEAKVTLNLAQASDLQRDVAVSFARRFESMDPRDLEQIRALLVKRDRKRGP